MRNFKIAFFLLFLVNHAIAQNVGVGTLTPVEKLDVNGNINLSGQLKVNGNAGTPNQVLIKDASNNLSWTDLSGYKNFAFVDCYNVDIPCTATNWTVPADVTVVVVECWGAGGGGSTMSGGSSGGYVLAKFAVTAGQTIVITPGNGGMKSSAAPDAGGNTTVSYAGVSITCYGGGPGKIGNPNTTGQVIQPSPGGGALVTGTGVQYLPIFGNSGKVSKISFVQSGSTVFGTKYEYGNGGDAPLQPASGGQGGYQVTTSSFSQSAMAAPALTAGAGGGADNVVGCGDGRGGRVIIRW